MLNLSNKGTQKLLATSAAFFIISNPQMYKITSKLPVIGPKLVKSDCATCPTELGLLVHTIVFAVLVRLISTKM